MERKCFVCKKSALDEKQSLLIEVFIDHWDETPKLVPIHYNCYNDLFIDGNEKVIGVCDKCFKTVLSPYKKDGRVLCEPCLRVLSLDDYQEDEEIDDEPPF